MREPTGWAPACVSRVSLSFRLSSVLVIPRRSTRVAAWRRILPVTDLAPEPDVLIACGFPSLESARRRVSELSAGPLDWPLLFELADQQGLLPLLSRALGGEGLNQPDDPARARVLAKIRAVTASKAARSLWMAGELTRIWRNLESAGITAVAFKGPALAHLAYGNVTLRDSTDIDLFVPREQLGRALDLLAVDGHRKRSEAWDTGFSGACEITLQRAGLDWALDLHWRFTPPYFLSFDSGRAVERSIVTGSAGFAVRTLCPEDHLLYLSIHGARKGWERVRLACDIAALVARCPLDWDDVERQAERTRCRRALGMAVILAHDLCGAPAPRDFVERARRVRAVRELAAEAGRRIGSATHLAGERGGARFHLRAMESARMKARYIWRRALQPNQLDAEWIPLPRGLSAAYYAVRPVRLACTALRRVFR